MARARVLKPGFFSNPELAALPCEARLLFAGLWTLADREGRLLDRPSYIHGQLFPHDHERHVDVPSLLGQLNAAGFLRRYTIDDRDLISVVKFGAHQHPHVREPESNLPPPPRTRPSTVPRTVQSTGPSTGPSTMLSTGPSTVLDTVLSPAVFGIRNTVFGNGSEPSPHATTEQGRPPTANGAAVGPDLSWAWSLRQREEGGERLTLFQREAWRKVLPRVEAEATADSPTKEQA
jgi:hypothetical protein